MLVGLTVAQVAAHAFEDLLVEYIGSKKRVWEQRAKMVGECGLYRACVGASVSIPLLGVAHASFVPLL